MTAPHFHRDERGFLVKCYHSTKSLLVDHAFWIGLTIGFPLEHFLWTKVWPFYELAELMGLIDHVH
jgi:hypothetical protein